MKSAYIKISAIGLVGVMVVVFLYYFHRVSEDYFVNSNKILFNINSLKKAEDKLNYDLLYTNIFLYQNNDVLGKDIKNVKNILLKLENDEFLKIYYKNLYIQLQNYKSAFKQKELLMFEYLRYSLPIKNVIIFLSNSIPYLSLKNKNAKEEILRIVSNILLLQRSSDIELIKNIYLNKLKNLLDFKNSYDVAFYRNIKVFCTYFPKQHMLFKQILNSDTSNQLKKMTEIYLRDTYKNVKYFENVMIFVVFFIALLFVILMVLIYYLEKNLEKIKFLAEHDQLTGLKNRLKYETELNKIKNPSLILFDVDKFKNINDFFGTEIGDEVLKIVASELKKHFNRKDIEIYRFGGDEFGVVFSNEDEVKLIKYAKEFIKTVESKTVKKNNFDISISVSAGITNKKPYLENADIALKFVKHDLKEKVKVYDEELNKNIEANIQKSAEIKKALENDAIVPYFQPIFDRNKNIYKYEVLCRVIEGDRVKSIFPYLDVLKENKMYHYVTKVVLEKSLKALKEKNLNLSINLSLEDIIDVDIREFIYDNFVDPDIAKRVTFEILESEVNSYDEMEEFINFLSDKGISFAIDDFGSGYSNFARVLKLKVDYIKIDGSIIKNIDHDENSRIILETLVDFAKRTNLKSVAEFIHNKEVFEIAKDIGVEYFQGFYLGEPVPLDKIKV